MHELLKKRHSGRSFDPKKRVLRAQVEALIEAARWAPSSYNDQPWRYIICDKVDDPEGYKKIFDALVEANQEWVQNVPLLIAVIADSRLRKNGKPNRHGQHDTGAATMSICLEASDLDLMTHQMAGFDKDKIQTSFNIPEQFTPMSIMAVGYEINEPPPADRKRLPIEENFFKGDWGVGYK